MFEAGWSLNKHSYGTEIHAPFALSTNPMSNSNPNLPKDQPWKREKVSVLAHETPIRLKAPKRPP